MRKDIIFFMLISLSIVQADLSFAQSDYRTPVLPPAPTSAVFSRYGNDQPSLQTGTVNIPISLFTISAKDVQIPLTLIYQTSGITITDMPYPAGYGWVFSPGLRVTRTVMGRPDELFAFNELVGSYDYEGITPGIVNPDIANLHELAYSDLFDTQKDIFTLSLPSGSYNFFINKNGSTYEAVTIGHQVKIEVLLDAVQIRGFKVTDPNGVIYMFGFDTGISFQDYSEPSPAQGCNAWMLREVIMLNGEKINFTWQKVNTNYYAAKVNSPIVVTDRQPQACPDLGGVHIDEVGGIIDYSSYSGANALMLKQISYPEGVIDLSYKSAQDPFLQTILVKNKNNEVIKNIGLTYGTNVNNASNRLLQSLMINGEIYSFQYNSNWFDVLSTAQDYWGYYNGKTSNTNLLPKMWLKTFDVFGGLGNDWHYIYQQVGYADRSVSAEHMKAFMLTKIAYPTGGYSEYEYEPHEFTPVSLNTDEIQSTDYISSGGGLRVSRIKNYTSTTATPIIKTFKYGINENGLANVSVLPTLETFIDEIGIGQELAVPCTGGYWRSERQMSINALSNYSKFLVTKSPIWYNRVTEYINNDQKTEYNFAFDSENEITLVTNYLNVKSPYAFRYYNLFNAGPRPTSTIVYKHEGATYTPLKEEINEYEAVDNAGLSTQNNMIIDRKGVFNHVSRPGPDAYPPNVYETGKMPAFAYLDAGFPASLDYQRLRYNISVRYDRLKKTTTIMHEGSQDISTYQNYLYNDYYQINKSISGTSIAGKEITIERKFPVDYSDAVSLQMVAKNILSPVIEEITYQNSTVLKRVRNNYTNSLAITNGLILPSSIETALGATGTYKTEVSFEKYDEVGNLLQKSYLNGQKLSYVWGYNRRYPVAEIENVDYTSIVSALGGASTVNTFAANTSPTESAVRSFIAPLRTAISGARVTTVTYRPLIGTSTMTDLNGRMMSYEYDAFNRLTVVRDQDNNILKKICYNFYGQPENCGLAAFSSAAKSGTFTRNNCGTNGTGSSVIYTVAAGTYTSLISQADADQQAQNDVNNNGQAYANANAGCTWTSQVKSGSFTRNDCGTNGTGGTVTYTVAAGTYSSMISLADANQKAQNAVNTGGQAYANANAGCTWTSQAQSGSFTRNNCATGGVGGTVIYNVAAGSYNSTISLADANLKAVNAMNTGGQAYANTNASCTWQNQEQIRYFTRNDCGGGLVGSGVNYTIPANTHSSTISQADANQLAYNAATTAGQAYANANGFCYCQCTVESQSCVNNVCETGIKVYTSSVFDESTMMWTCYYHYEFSNGSWSATYSETSGMACYQP
ncbi:MAG: DUF5977 domain-containing protein [Chitinophagaceae bacterium]